MTTEDITSGSVMSRALEHPLTMSRRAALRGMGTSLTAAALGTAAAPALSAELESCTELTALIDAHRAAAAAYDLALDAESEANERVNTITGTERRLTPVSVAADGSPARGGKVEVRYYDKGASAREHIAAFHENLRRSYCTGTSWAESAFPGHDETMAQAIYAAECRALDALAKAVSDYEQLLIDMGLTTAEAETHRASHAEADALAAVWVFRPRSEEELVTKRDYLAAHEAAHGDIGTDDMTVEAIMRLLRNELAPSANASGEA